MKNNKKTCPKLPVKNDKNVMGLPLHLQLLSLEPVEIVHECHDEPCDEKIREREQSKKVQQTKKQK